VQSSPSINGKRPLVEIHEPMNPSAGYLVQQYQSRLEKASAEFQKAWGSHSVEQARGAATEAEGGTGPEFRVGVAIRQGVSTSPPAGSECTASLKTDRGVEMAALNRIRISLRVDRGKVGKGSTGTRQLSTKDRS
jgi:hypothetical protein